MSSNEQSVTFRAPDELVRRLDEIARLEQRNRSNLIVKILTIAVEETEAQQETKKGGRK
jgi:predicted transcriptional regulator